MGGLAPSRQCFNPSNTGGSFSPFLPTPAPLPTPLFSLGNEVYLLVKETLLLLLLLLGRAPLSLLRDLSLAREGRAGALGLGPGAQGPAGAPLLSCVRAARHFLCPCLPPTLPPCLPPPACPAQALQCGETHKPYCPLGAGAEPFCCSAPRRVRVTQLIKTVLF